MAQSALEILIDVLSSEAVTSTDEFIKVITDAVDKVGTLSVSVDELDTALSGIAKSGASADDMGVQLVTTLEDLGIQVKDADGLAAAFSEKLKAIGASGKEAADGVGLVTKANEDLAGSSKVTTDVIDRETGSLKLLATGSVVSADTMVAQQARVEAGAVEAAAAIETMGTGYAKVATTAELATPALMKAATWAGIGLAGLAYEGIKQYTQFNKLITQTITQAGEAPSKMGFLSGLAESVAKSTGQNLTDVANTIYRAASGTAAWNNGLGATKKQLGDIVTQVSKLNVVGGIATGAESEQASRVVTALINSNIRGVGKNPTEAAALVNAVVGSGDMRLGDLVPGIGRGLLSSAVANNVSAKDVMAWVATLTSQGTTASVAGNYVKTGINLLAHPSAQGVEALAMLGIKPGEMENLMSGPGGLVSAVSTLKSGMKQLKPSDMAKFFFHEAGAVYPGGSGLTGAVAKLQTWSAGELSPKFIKDWEANKLTAQEQTQATDLILTKAFGGSKQFATIAAVINNLGLLKGIEGHISAEDTPGYFNAQYRRTEATPSQQFARMKQNLLVDLVNIGKTLTPLALTFGHIMTGVIDGLSKFKGVLYGFVTLAVGLLGAAAYGKGAQLLSHLAPVIGAGYNRLGVFANRNMLEGENSAFTTKMMSKANAGKFKYLNIYEGKKGKVLSKLGGEAISSGEIPTTDAALAEGAAVKGLSKGDNALLSAQARANGFLGEIAANTRVSDAEGSGGGARFGGKGGAVESEESGAARYAPQYRDPVTGRFLSAAESAPLAARAAEEESAASMAAGYYGATGRGRGIKSFSTNMMGGADTALSNVESLTGAEGVESVAAPALLDTGEAATGGLIESLGGLAGGPVGMMGMMMAPMLLSLASPLIGKLGGLFSHLFSGSSGPAFHPHNKNQLDVTTAAAKLAAATKALRAYQHLVKNKAGKSVWENDTNAMLADGVGYWAAHQAYIKAGGERALALRDARAVDMNAESYLYGNKKNVLSRLQRAAAQHITSGIITGMGTVDMNGYTQNNPKNASKDASALHSYVAAVLADTATPGVKNHLPHEIRSLVAKNGDNFKADYQDISKILGAQHKYYQATFNDASQQSIQSLRKQGAGTLADMLTGGLFSNNSALKTNHAEISSILNNRSIGPTAAAALLPLHAEEYHRVWQADKKALDAKTASGAYEYTGEAREAFKAQAKDAKDQLVKTDKLIQEMRKAAEDTKLNDGSIQKLAKDNATALMASGLPAAIANALATTLSPYMKRSTVAGTGGTVTGTTHFPGFVDTGATP